MENLGEAVTAEFCFPKEETLRKGEMKEDFKDKGLELRPQSMESLPAPPSSLNKL